MTDLLHPPETASTALDRWRLGEGFLIRAAGQPAEAVAGLRSARARAWAEEVLAAENRTIPGTFERATLSQVKERFSFLQKCRSRFDKAKFELEEASVIELDEI